MSARRWTPIRRALEARQQQLLAYIQAPVEANTFGKDDADQAVASLRHDEVLGTRSRARERLAVITLALARLDDGTFGTCVDCAGDISLPRLTATLTADTCIECATKREANLTEARRRAWDDNEC